MAAITCSQFIKFGSDNTVVLLETGGTKQIFEFGGGSVDDSNYVKKAGQELQLIHRVLRRDEDEVSLSEDEDNYLTRAEIYNAFVSRYDNQTIYGTKTFNLNVNATGFVKTGKDDTLVLLAGDAAGLSDFPELYAYIKERYLKPIGELPQPVPIGEHTPQQQVKNNDDIIYRPGDGSNEVFEPPVPNAITKLDLSSQLELQSFLASSGSDLQLIVYSNRITLIASYATTGLFPNEYLFKSYPSEARPKLDDQMIASVGTDAPNIYVIFCYIDQNFAINDFFLSSAFNTFYVVDDSTCRVCLSNQYFESKGLQGRTQEVGHNLYSVVSVDGKNSIPQESADTAPSALSALCQKFSSKTAASLPFCIFSKIKQLVQKVGKGLQWASDNVYQLFIKPFAKTILGALGPVGQTIGKSLDVASSFLDYGYGADKNGQFRQDFDTLRNDEYLRQKLLTDIQS
ncbi:MAG: hypothetical protein EZS28_018126 [Streblomastix strix]|uniref:Uncharacterized protein n=1 Tax=Streblomastix strix TaxID=222440 RepID=A0A5J4VUN5_9EUKA|nr:MAG: hypothetical protein EZS28_018126 [Streblomastix strix]